ncbi:MAG: LacI family DNA-binding transcriptional regulator [Akkermansiaceae bacterium]|nr:LacI family DNA-binding transcriptional regulator [Armatimonadota bacterium]
MSSIREVAKHAGVSPATVSRAFGTPNLINEQTKIRVFESARTLDYAPPRQRSISEAKTRQRLQQRSASFLPDTLGFQFFSPGDETTDTISANTFYAPVLSGAQAEAQELGVHLLVNTTNRHRLLKEPPRMVREKTIGGMLLVGTADKEVLDVFRSYTQEMVLVDHHHADCPFESIISDSFGGAYAATRHLIELGHRKIGFFLGGLPMGTFQYRENGYLSALFAEDIAPNPEWVIGESENVTQLISELRAVLTATDRPTAIVAANDHNALMVLRLCAEIGLRVPQDLSVIGFDDIEFASHAAPPLTTVRVNKEFMGRYAVRRLWERIGRRANTARREEDAPPICHVLPVTLVVRQSCCPPRL